MQFSAEDATRSDFEFLCQVIEQVIAAGATTINLPDTVGYCTPDEMGEFFTKIIATVPSAKKAVFSAHCHDDLGLAVANTIAAVRAGVRQVECTINGIGERAGNASLEEIVMISKVRPDRTGFTTGVKTPQLYATSQLLSQLTGEPVQANKAIVGRNAFAHESGIHQDGMLKDRRTYEIMNPEDVGVPEDDAGAGQAFGASRGAEALRGARVRADEVRARSCLPSDDGAGRSSEGRDRRGAGDAASRPSSRPNAHATSGAPHVEVGYGHGV